MGDTHENSDIDETSDPCVRLRALGWGRWRRSGTAFRLVVTEFRQGGMQLLFVHLEDKERTVGAYRTGDAHGGKYECTLFAS
jgi:hypothetical protein